MISIQPEPIENNWTTTPAGARDTTNAATNATHRPTPAPATAVAIAQAVGEREINELAGWQAELAAVVADLAANAGSGWPFGHDDPTVALLRALGKLALVSPETTSDLGAQLIEALPSRTQTRS